ncbi:MAG: non-heme iron oxygenase ferredoxin subunit [Gemmatimonadetes bacterium]|nr:non-heme iron oxygenase ferredoxin subunit [Gemmatimonadota bacterium]
MAGWVKVAARSDLPKRGLAHVEAGGEKICLVMTGDGAVYALKDRCSHEDYPLSDGELMSDDRRVECIYHGAKFDVASGRAVALPAIRPVKTYPVKVEGEDVLVELG